MSAKDADRKDSYSYRGVVKRDAQHSHDGPEVAPHRSKKKKGCKRNKWGPHEESDEWVYPASYYRVKVCKYCGKHMTHNYKRWNNDDEWEE